MLTPPKAVRASPVTLLTPPHFLLLYNLHLGPSRPRPVSPLLC